MASTQVVIKKVGPVGGSGGAVKDMNINGINRIVKIGVLHGSAIDGLIVRFQHDNGTESTKVWGKSGEANGEFNLEDSEYITSVKGHYGNFNGMFVIRSLKFETNLRSYGHYGLEEEFPFELPAISGQIIGFYGRSGALLDALGVYVKDREESLKKELKDCEQKLKDTMAEYLKISPKLRAQLDSSDDLQKNLKSLVSNQVVIKKVGPVGGGGRIVKDMNIYGISRILKISVLYGSAIDGLVVHFRHDSGRESKEVWGKDGQANGEFSLKDSEYITSVKGHCGNLDGMFVLRSLKFETNFGSYGPYGGKKALEIPFELTAISGQIIGFHGRFGNHLDALGVYIKVTEASVQKELGDCKQNLKYTAAKNLKLLPKLRAELDDKVHIQKTLESEIESLKIKNDELTNLRAELDNKDEIQKKLKYEIESLQSKNNEFPKLRAELDNKDDIQKTLESEIKNLENENEELQTKEKGLKDAIKELLQSRECKCKKKACCKSNITNLVGFGVACLGIALIVFKIIKV